MIEALTKSEAAVALEALARKHMAVARARMQLNGEDDRLAMTHARMAEAIIIALESMEITGG